MTKLKQFLIVIAVLFAAFTFSANAQCTCDTNYPPYGFGLIQGTVKDSSNNPIKNVEVTAVDVLTGADYLTYTDQYGNYTFSQANSYYPSFATIGTCRSYNIQIQQNGVSPTNLDVFTNPQTTGTHCKDPLDADFTYNPTCDSSSPVLSGQIIDQQTQSPLSNVTVKAYDEFLGFNSFISTTTDSNGNYSFSSSDGLSPCTHYVVQATPPHGYFFAPFALDALTSNSNGGYTGLGFLRRPN